MDKVSQIKRSQMMSLIRSKNTRPEKLVRSFLHRHGFRYRLYSKELPGKPDLVLPKYRSIIFVHGCFWHGHSDPSCRRSNIPKSNVNYWVSKIEKNRERDKTNTEKLKKLGWRVFIIWECKINNNLYLEKLAHEIRNYGINGTLN